MGCDPRRVRIDAGELSFGRWGLKVGRMARAVGYACWFLGLGLLACSSTTEVPTGTGTGGSCAVGGPGCPCTEQGVCDPGLVCVPDENTCVLEEECNVGSPGCECTEGGHCDEGHVCMEGICVSDEPCNPELTGTEGCQCTMGGGCDEGLICLSDTCVMEMETTSTGSSSTSGSSSSTGSVDGSSTGG